VKKPLEGGGGSTVDEALFSRKGSQGKRSTLARMMTKGGGCTCFTRSSEGTQTSTGGRIFWEDSRRKELPLGSRPEKTS